MSRVLRPPAPIELLPGERSVFLAGTIEMGQAVPWQAFFEDALRDLPVAILHPRRDSWDASWQQSIDSPQFREQVEWELAGLERADVVAMYFAPDSKSPITLLELGLVAPSRRLVVCCAAGFWRRGNIEVVCARYGVTLLSNIAQLVAEARGRFG